MYNKNTRAAQCVLSDMKGNTHEQNETRSMA